jgi:hypothetical protein
MIIDTSKFLDQLLGTEKGWVSTAFKRGERVWKERTFEWPAQKAKLLKWAEVNSPQGDVFICPAVRIRDRRTKGDGKGLMWLWADVDFEKIPTNKHGTIQDRIKKLGTLVVSSGSGDNRHVYVRLEHEVTAAEHEILNTGLRDYLMADNKQADNSLLRLPGTQNHKPGNNGAKVYVVNGNKKAIDPEALMERPTWQAVKVEGSTSSSDWTPVDITKIFKGSLKSLIEMRNDEAEGRFGSRHKAVYAVTQELIKRGLNSDQIHTLMDKFAPAVSKNKTEHGGYDVHKDVARVMMRQPTIDVVSDQEGPDEESDIPEEVQKELKRRQHKRLADEYEAQLTFKAPPDDSSGSLAHYQAAPPREVKYLIEGIAGAHHNVVIAGQYKTGKTLFITNIIRSLADGVPFLDKFEVHMPDGRVGMWSAEMDPQELIDDYFRPQDVQNPSRVQLLHMQGERINLLSQVGRAWTIAWLKRHNVKVWMIDSLARIGRMAGVDENDNGAVHDLLAAIDECKKAAGVEATFLIAHTGRAQMEEGKERARGATALDDWTDARWVLIKEKDIRMFSVPEGRGVQLDQASIHRDDATMRLSFGIAGASRATVTAEKGVESVIEAAHILTVQRGKDRVIQRDLYTLLKEWKIASGNRGRIAELVMEAVETGRIVEELKAPGAKRAQGVFYRMPDEGVVEFDFSKVDDKPRRSKKAVK